MHACVCAFCTIITATLGPDGSVHQTSSRRDGPDAPIDRAKRAFNIIITLKSDMGAADVKAADAAERGAALLHSAKDGGAGSDGSAGRAAADAAANPFREIAEAGIAAHQRGDKGAGLGSQRASPSSPHPSGATPRP